MKATPVSWEISPDLFLVCHPLSTAAAPPPKPEAVHHILCVDVSGSMYADLPRIREQLKTKLVTMLGEDDAISIIWFSGRGECDVLLEAVQPNAKDLSNIRTAVDRWLRPMGLTGFKEPIERAGEVIRRAAGKSNRKPALTFMTDGCENQWSRDDVLRAVSALAPQLGAAAFVEYGYYADRPLLSKMAERAGGSLVLAADFDAYEPVFEAAMRRKPAATKTQVVINANPHDDIVFAIDGGQPVAYAVDLIGTKAGVSVPAHVETLYYLSGQPVGPVEGKLASQAYAASTMGLKPGQFIALTGAYAALSLFAQRIRPKTIWSVLRAIGDVALIDDFGTCFGKQRYSAFIDVTTARARGEKWFEKGYDPKRAPDEGAFTLLDLFELLASDPRCRVYTESGAFIYSRIGRKSVTKDKILTVKERDEVAVIADDLKAKAPSGDVAALREVVNRINKILNERKPALRFVLDKAEAERGYSFDALVWNTDMVNASFRVKKKGYVDLSSLPDDVPEDIRKALPDQIPTHLYRSYAWVKDGLVNIDFLPVFLPETIAQTLVAVGVIDKNRDAVFPVEGGVSVTLDLRRIPIINQRMITSASARTLAELEWQLLTFKAAAKVFKHYKPEREETGLASAYGAAAAAWLKEQGLTDGGFNPPAIAAPAVDFYLARAIRVKIPGFSSLPKVEDVRDRMNPPKPEPGKKAAKPKELTAAMKLMEPYVREIESFITSEAYLKADDPKAVLDSFIIAKEREATTEKRKVEYQIARLKFATLVSGGWLSEFNSFDENSLDVDLGGEKRTVTFDLDEAVKVYI